MIEGDKKFKGVVFDLDGTLVNSLEDLADSMNEVLSRYHYPVHEVPAYKLFIGNGMRNLVRVTLPEAERNEQTIAEC
ncbi:MAG: HAD hydrolase-like protein, partial [Bacteroidota bacterium]|nr:HAD hydrolase-like protein [Bacteroidota bacterium]